MLNIKSSSLAYLGNLFALLGINGILTYAFFDQFYVGELPCPLCIMQRIGFMLIGFALVLNLRFGVHFSHYGWGILAGLVGMTISLRQVLLHILPGDKGFGATFLGMHFYTWAFVTFLALLVAQAILLLLPNRDVRSRSGITNFAIVLFVLLVFSNLLSTLLECGGGACPDDPIRYEGLLWLRSHFNF